MPTNNDFLAALPTGTTKANKDLLRNANVQRNVYTFADSENPSDFVAVTLGVTTLAIAFNRRIFFFDPADTTTPGDNITVIVSSDGKRYKTDDLNIPYSVLDWDQTTPAVGPAIGDAYLTSAAPTGAWSANPEEMAIYTSRGWLFVAPRIGQFFYVEDGDFYVHLDTNGDLVTGLGASINAPLSVPYSAAIGWGMIFSVENATTNAPPSAGQGVSYLVGPSPTGAWSGFAGYIAVRETSGTSTTYTLYAPTKGMRIHNKALNSDYQYNGSAWVSASGAAKSRVFNYTSNATFTKHANSIEVEVHCSGGGSLAGFGSGGIASFGSFLSASGGSNAIGSATQGSGSGGDINLNGGVFSPQTPFANTASLFYGPGPFPGSPMGVNPNGYGATGGYAYELIDSSLLNTTEAVTVGTGARVVVIERYRG